MAPKYHPTPLSGGDRKALKKELGKSRAMTGILSAQADDLRSRGEALLQKSDNLACQSWNERMWSDGDAIETAARSQNLELIRKYVQDLVDDTVGDGRLNDNRFHKEIWQPLPKNLKRQNGKPDADWHERWDAAKGDLLKKLKLVQKGLLASDKMSAQSQRR